MVASRACLRQAGDPLAAESQARRGAETIFTGLAATVTVNEADEPPEEPHQQGCCSPDRPSSDGIAGFRQALDRHARPGAQVGSQLLGGSSIRYGPVVTCWLKVSQAVEARRQHGFTGAKA